MFSLTFFFFSKIEIANEYELINRSPYHLTLYDILFLKNLVALYVHYEVKFQKFWVNFR